MKKALGISIGFLTIIGLISHGSEMKRSFVQVLADQKKRDACYAVGITNLPTGEDQSMLQGNHAYQECLNSR